MRAATEESKMLQQGQDENSEVTIVTVEPRFAAGCFSRFSSVAVPSLERS